VTRSVALAVAVTKIHDFPSLPGAAEGAKAFAGWAGEQGFEEVVLLTDQYRPVRVDELYRVADGAVRSGAARLFIFFAGHGLARGFGEDLWLLSEAPGNPGEAVDVAQSLRFARHSGIPHIAVFADSCRTAAEGTRLLAVTGRSIFPAPYPSPNICELDQFYAAAPGQAAWERHPSNPESPPYGIYTRCLLTALSGSDCSALSPVDDGQAPQAVLSHRLRDYLGRVVPTAVWQETGKQQWPDSLPGSFWKPNVLAWVPPTAPASRSPASPLPDGGQGSSGTGPVRDEGMEPTLNGAPDEPFPSLLESPEVSAAIRREEAVCRRAGTPGLAIRQGRPDNAVFVAGAVLRDAVRLRPSRDAQVARSVPVLRDGEDWRVTNRLDSPGPILLHLGEDHGPRITAATVTFPGYITVLRASRRGVEQVIYLPIGGTTHEIEATFSVLARASVLGRMNLFDPGAPEWASLVFEQLNPGLAAQAAYTWERQGDQRRIGGLKIFNGGGYGLVTAGSWCGMPEG
jgi:hypothetical protein